jgi:hypothetical protein
MTATGPIVASTSNAQSDVQIKSIFFFAGGGNFIPAESWRTWCGS